MPESLCATTVLENFVLVRSVWFGVHVCSCLALVFRSLKIKSLWCRQAKQSVLNQDNCSRGQGVTISLDLFLRYKMWLKKKTIVIVKFSDEMFIFISPISMPNRLLLFKFKSEEGLLRASCVLVSHLKLIKKKIQYF